jgi:hypothetical protein
MIEANSAIISDGNQLVLYEPSPEKATPADDLIVALYRYLEAHPEFQLKVKQWHQSQQHATATSH